MGYLRSLFCTHQWDDGWEHSKHQCTKCGKREPHDWVLVTDPKAQVKPANNQAGQAAPQTFRCSICGAMRLR